MEDSEKLMSFLKNSSNEKITKLIERLESTNDHEFIEYAEFLKSLFR